MSETYDGPGNYDWPVWVGNTTPLRVGLSEGGSAIDLTGSLFVVTITWPEGALTLRTDDAVPSVVLLDQVNPSTRGYLVITLTPAQTRLLPVGGAIQYEIERRWDGTEKTYLQGPIIAQTRNNTDG
jgi:hypothetical protein